MDWGLFLFIGRGHVESCSEESVWCDVAAFRDINTILSQTFAVDKSAFADLVALTFESYSSEILALREGEIAYFLDIAFENDSLQRTIVTESVKFYGEYLRDAIAEDYFLQSLALIVCDTDPFSGPPNDAVSGSGFSEDQRINLFVIRGRNSVFFVEEHRVPGSIVGQSPFRWLFRQSYSGGVFYWCRERILLEAVEGDDDKSVYHHYGEYRKNANGNSFGSRASSPWGGILLVCGVSSFVLHSFLPFCPIKSQ